MEVFFRAKVVYSVFMVNPHSRNSIPFDSPATYQVIVQGRIDPTWSDRFEDMQISLSSAEGTPSVTTLVGMLCDQAALAGVLNTLYELHLPVLSVKRLEK